MRSDFAASYRIASSHISAEEFDGEVVVLDLESGAYYSLTGGAGLVWGAASSGRSMHELLDLLADDAPRMSGVEDTLNALIDAGLIAPSDGEPSSGADETAAQIKAVPSEFGIEAFGELAELFKADPIHDVDEQAGWPHKPASDKA